MGERDAQRDQVSCHSHTTRKQQLGFALYHPSLELILSLNYKIFSTTRSINKTFFKFKNWNILHLNRQINIRKKSWTIRIQGPGPLSQLWTNQLHFTGNSLNLYMPQFVNLYIKKAGDDALKIFSFSLNICKFPAALLVVFCCI